MPEEGIKFTPEELGAITELQQKYTAITFRFGQLYMDKEAIERSMTQNAVDLDNTKNELGTIRAQERSLANTLQTKYGEGKLNPQTGEFTPGIKPPVQ